MSRRAIFVDTSAWYALQVTDDEFHPATAAVFPKILDRYETLVTSNHVVGETYTLLRTARGFREAWRFVDALGSSPRVEVRVTWGPSKRMRMASCESCRISLSASSTGSASA